MKYELASCKKCGDAARCDGGPVICRCNYSGGYADSALAAAKGTTQAKQATGPSANAAPNGWIVRERGVHADASAIAKAFQAWGDDHNEHSTPGRLRRTTT